MAFGIVQICLGATEALKDGHSKAVRRELLFRMIVSYAPLEKLVAAE